VFTGLSYLCKQDESIHSAGFRFDFPIFYTYARARDVFYAARNGYSISPIFIALIYNSSRAFQYKNSMWGKNVPVKMQVEYRAVEGGEGEIFLAVFYYPLADTT